MPDPGDVATEYVDREMNAALKALRRPVAIVWRRTGRSPIKLQLLTDSSHYRAVQALEAKPEKVNIDKPLNWAIVFFKNDGSLSQHGDPKLFGNAEELLKG